MRNEELVELPPEFPGQRPDETVIMVLYKHWYKIFFQIAKSLLVIFLSFAVPIWLGITDFIFSFPITAFIYYTWHVYWVGAILYDYMHWYRDRYIITDHRIIDIDQKGLFKRRVSEIDLEKVQNITHAVEGMIPTMLNFGTVIIQSAGAHDITLDDIAAPADIQEDITRLVKDVTKKHRVDPELIDLINTENLL